MKNLKKIVFIISISLSLYIEGYSLEETDKSKIIRNLDELVELAIENNRELRSLKNKSKATRERQNYISKLSDPIFNYTEYVEEVETRVGPQKRSYSLSQKFPFYGKRKARASRESLRANSQEYFLSEKRSEVVYKCRRFWYEYYLKNKSIDFIDQHIQLLKRIEKVLQVKLKSSKFSYADLLKLQGEIVQLEDRSHTLKEKIKGIEKRMYWVIGSDQVITIEKPNQVDIPIVSLSKTKTLERVIQNNGQLMALKSMEQAEGISVVLAKKDRWPDLGLGVKKIETDPISTSSALDNGKDPVMVSLSINIPIWRNKLNSKIKEANFKHSEKRFLYENFKLKLEAEVEDVFILYEDSKRKVDLYQKDLIPRAEQVYDLVRKQYETAERSIVDLIDAEKHLLSLQLIGEEVKIKQAKSAAKILYLMNEELRH